MAPPPRSPTGRWWLIGRHLTHGAAARRSGASRPFLLLLSLLLSAVARTAAWRNGTVIISCPLGGVQALTAPPVAGYRHLTCAEAQSTNAAVRNLHVKNDELPLSTLFLTSAGRPLLPASATGTADALHQRGAGAGWRGPTQAFDRRQR